ncbi:MAG: hypothetical protein K2X27_06910 [Candidatus Obscuribacterales bacterium]|nr:hypothetical protein [Candidatus Obscuribacterales bacterium]
MGEQDAHERVSGKDSLERVSEQSEKLADFGKSLWGKGKSLAEGVQKEVEKIDVKGLADKAGEQIRRADLEDLAKKAGKAVQNVDAEKLSGAAGIAAGLGFPQLSLLNKGSSEVGDLIARKQAKSLLDNPKTLADKLLCSFDELDREKSGFLDDAKLRRNDGITGIGSENRALAQIMRSGFSTFNSLDGDLSAKGISRADIQAFGLMQNKDLLRDHVSNQAFNHGLFWGGTAAVGFAAGSYLKQVGADFSLQALKSLAPGKIAAVATIGAIGVGVAADLISKHQANKFYENKSRETDAMLKAMKNSF